MIAVVQAKDRIALPITQVQTISVTLILVASLILEWFGTGKTANV